LHRLRRLALGKKKWCFGREDVICMTKDCPYMSDCIQVVWEKKMGRLMQKGQSESGSLTRLKSKLKKEERQRKKERTTT
jgi:hypothetical protein